MDNVKRIYLAIGGVCVLFGVGLLAVAGYGMIEDDSGEPGVYVRPAWPSASPDVADASAEPTGAASLLGSGPFRLVIEKLDVDAPVAAFGLDENAVPEVPYEAQLIAWYNFSAYPGTGDNAVFAGHKTWNGEAVFYDLEQLGIGDDIVLRGENGAQLTYRVSDVEVVDPADRSALQWMEATGTDSITLITCGGERFFTNTIAGADYTHRVVVRAERV